MSDIEQGENPLVHVHDDKRQQFEDGDYVKFSEVEGMSELNYLQYVQIFECRAFSFRLRLDTRGFGKYLRQGMVENVKVPKPLHF